MAIDVCSEISSAGVSPRISFSHDLDRAADSLSIVDHNRRLDSSLLDPDFNFSIGNSFVSELSSADELFANGKILPIEIKKTGVLNDQPKPTTATSDSQQITTTTTATDNTQKKLLKEFLSMSIDPEEKPISRSFWHFRRSHSMNCDSRNKGLLRSLQFLSRCNSTGSAPNSSNQSMPSKETRQKPHWQKQHSLSSSSKSSMSSSGSFYSYNSSHKPPPLRKCKSYGNGARISPVLNILPPSISSGTVNLFGFGSLCAGTVKKKKR